MAGGSVRLTCHIPRDPLNRSMAWGILYADALDETDSYDREELELHGADSRMTFERLIAHVPCDAGAAFCTVTDAYGQTSRAIASLQVVCPH